MSFVLSISCGQHLLDENDVCRILSHVRKPLDTKYLSFKGDVSKIFSEGMTSFC